LAAFALENLIKAFLIYENPHYIARGKLSSQLINGHSLSKLQRKSKQIPSPKRTRHVFETLESGISSWARYPCATSVERETKESMHSLSYGRLTIACLIYTAENWSIYCRRSGMGLMECPAMWSTNKA
jgi:hypothetical protein